MKPNIRKFVEIVSSAHQVGPVAEFGSRQPIDTDAAMSNMRPLFTWSKYTGYDLHKGPGVDRIMDMEKCRGLASSSIGTILCLETLEHTPRPWRALEQAARVIKPRGMLVISMPFAFPIHHLPDFWRLTPQGMAQLLQSAGFASYFVFGQGVFGLPHTVFALASPSKAVVLNVGNALVKHQNEIPRTCPEDRIWPWVDDKYHESQWHEHGQDTAKFSALWSAPAPSGQAAAGKYWKETYKPK